MTETTKEVTYHDATFHWGDEDGGADVRAVFRRNRHGWFCESVDGQEWLHPTGLGDTKGTRRWGTQIAKDTPEQALHLFLRRYNKYTIWKTKGGYTRPSQKASNLTVGPPRP
jgi:hypothetical protein